MVSAKKAAAEYNASSIEVLSGLEPVYTRPGMYTDTSSPTHLAQEVIDNSVDEALAGYATKIEVEIKDNGEMVVMDNGRGMPVDTHAEYGISGVELILTRLHSGAKFSTKNYKFSGGLHGVGVSVVNALSQELKVEVWQQGRKYLMEFSNGVKLGELKEVANPEKLSHGTRITFRANPKYFDEANFATTRLRQLVHSKAILCPGLKSVFIDDKATRTNQPKRQEWRYKRGISDYVTGRLEEHELVPAEIWFYETQSAGKELSCAVAWDLAAAGGQTLSESYVNLIPTALGGTHVNSLRTGLYEAIKEFCERRNLLDKTLSLNSDDVWRSCNYLLSVKLDNPQFAGQTKERLAAEQQTAFIGTQVRDALILWLNSNPKQAETLAQLVIMHARERLKRAEQAKKKRKLSRGLLPAKLADCLSKRPEECELFLVEGDSAGGSAKQARDKKTQAIMPLRGKILNTWELSSSRIMDSQEVQDISSAIGVLPDSPDLSGLRYHKICILADADSDGMHIASLLCVLFVRHFTELVKEGKVYIAMPPLYRLDQGKEVSYALTEAEKEQLVAKLSKKTAALSIQRFKGLGEMNMLQLKETTMAPQSRRLVALEMGNEQQVRQTLDMLFKKQESNARRRWLSEGD